MSEKLQPPKRIYHHWPKTPFGPAYQRFRPRFVYGPPPKYMVNPLDKMMFHCGFKFRSIANRFNVSRAYLTAVLRGHLYDDNLLQEAHDLYINLLNALNKNRH